jgi:hypothetical protein
VFLCRRGHAHEDSLDLTQGFFHEVVLERQLFEHADQLKGRFRTYLLTTLQRFVAEQYRKTHAKRRMPRSSLTSMASLDLLDTENVESEATPEQIFQYTWAVELMDRALNEIQREYAGSNKTQYWQVFNDRVVIPILDNSAPPSLTELCRRYSIQPEKKVSNMIITVKRRFQGILRRILSETMEADVSVEDELADLISISSKGSAV